MLESMNANSYKNRNLVILKNMNRSFFAALVLCGAAAAASEAQGAKKPNVVLFLVDDMGWQDTSVPFDTVRSAWNNVYQTPAMERLAAKGVKFTQAYASAISSPTRVSLLTSMNPVAHRVTNWTLHRDSSQDTRSQKLDLPSWNVNGLQPVGTNINNTVEATTLPELLHANGYATIHCGKAHFGAIDTPGADPRALGFDVNIAGHAAGGLASYLGEKNFGNETDPEKTQSPFAVPGLEKYWGKNIFATEVLTIEALAAIDTLRATKPDKPFFLYLSHYAVHTPLNVDERFYGKYRAAGLDHTAAAYAALVEGMDKSLGDVMEYLDKNGLADNTIIIFMSDNGGLSACGRSGTKDRHNWPLRSGKGSAYEGGTRVPMIIFDPRSTRAAASIEETPVEVTDLMPTILEMGGVKRFKTVQKRDGASFRGLLYGKKLPWATDRTFVWHYPNRWDCSGEGIGTFSSIRHGDYKLIYFYDTERTELFDVVRDLSEERNLADDPAYADLRARLAAELTAYLKSHDGQLPTLRATGEKCAYPR